MSNRQQGWPEVGRRIRARMAELKVTKAQVIRASDVSAKTLDAYLSGQPIVRADKARGLCDALGWTVDSIDRILAGEEPIAKPRTEAAIMDDPLLDDAARQFVIDVYRSAVDTVAGRSKQ